MKGEVPAKGTSPFFLIIIKFGTFFTHFEMILLYPEPYLSYFWCRIKRNRTNIMKTTIKYICTGLSLCACTCLVNNLPAQAETTNTAAVSATETGLDRQSIMEVARRVADWQIKDYPENKYAKSEPRGWIAGALYMGMFDWAELSGDNTYYDWLRKIFNRQSWQVANRMYHADDVCIAQTYIDFYNKEKNENMLKPTIARADWVLNNPSNGSMDLDYSKGSTIERWTWCDALFMAPGVYTRLYTLTGNRKYMHFADSEFRATYNHLYDKDEDLFYRDSRYIGQKEANGKKIFWGRGNGWVIGGLAEILKTLPAEDTEFRPFYLELYKEMSERLAGLQGKDGYWHASLLDPDSYPSPETSATGFIVYGLAYGINQGYLPADKDLPVVKKGWEALTRAVETNGKLGWVQPVGADPKKVTRDMTELYGTGAFLMAASEIYKLADK